MNKPLLTVLLPLCLAACGGAPAAPEAPAMGEAPAATPEGDAAEPAAGAAAEEGGSAETPALATAGDGAAEAPAAPPKNETKRQRRKRLKEGRMAQCQAVGGAMQNIQQQVTIAAVTDKKALRRVSGELDRLAADMAKIKIEPELTDLSKLRDDYVVEAKAMSGNLSGAAETTDLAVQKKEIADFRKREAKSQEFVPKLNEVCNAPLE